MASPQLFSILLCILSYLIGSVPFGLILTRLAGLGDIRAIGSGNIGATNVLRTGNKALAFATLLLDGGKGALAVYIGHLLAPANEPMLPVFMGLSAVVGHIFPVWLKFKGGKGVATALGFILAANWHVGLMMLLTWLIVAFTFRISSLAAIVAVIACPFYAFYDERVELFLPFAGLSLLILWKHRENIQRIFKGAEPKIGKKT